MHPYLAQQHKLQSKQKIAFLLIAAGAAIGFIFPPVAVIAIYGILSYWHSTWRIHKAKCPSCQHNVGLVRPYSNEKCRHCGEVFIQTITVSTQEGQDQWLK